MSPIRCSVLITTFNRPDYLAVAIESALSQSIAGVEVVVSDDCGNEENSRVAAGFGDRVKYFRSSENHGTAGCTRLGLALCRGEYVMFLNDDDALYPTAVEESLRGFAEAPEALLTYGFHIPFGPDGVRPPSPPPGYVPPVRGIRSPMVVEVFQNGGALASGACYLRRAIPDGQPEDSYGFGWDHALILETCRDGQPGFQTGLPTAWVRHHDEQATWVPSASVAAGSIRLHVEQLRNPLTRRPGLVRTAGPYFNRVAEYCIQTGQMHLARRFSSHGLRWKPTAKSAAVWTISRLPAKLASAVVARRPKLGTLKESTLTELLAHVETVRLD